MERKMNQYTGKAFELLICAALNGETPENKILENLPDLAEIKSDVNEFLKVFGTPEKVEWLGGNYFAECDLIADGKKIELKYTSGGNGTYYNTSIYTMVEYGFDYREYLWTFGIYNTIALVPKVSVNNKLGSPVSHEDSLYIRNNFPDIYKQISEKEAECRRQFVKDIYYYFSKNFNIFIDFLNKMLRKNTKCGLPDTIYVYNYKKKETKVIEISDLLKISSNFSLELRGNSLKYGNIRITFGWQNGNGLNNPTVRIFID